MQELQKSLKGAYQGKGIASALFVHNCPVKEIFSSVIESQNLARKHFTRKKMAVIADRKAYYHDPVEDAIIMKREN